MVGSAAVVCTQQSFVCSTAVLSVQGRVCDAFTRVEQCCVYGVVGYCVVMCGAVMHGAAVIYTRSGVWSSHVCSRTYKQAAGV